MKNFKKRCPQCNYEDGLAMVEDARNVFWCPQCGYKASLIQLANNNNNNKEEETNTKQEKLL